MRAKREFRCRVLEIVPWVDEGALTLGAWVHCSPSEAKGVLKQDISKVERMESIEVHVLGDSPIKRVVIKVSEEG